MNQSPLSSLLNNLWSDWLQRGLVSSDWLTETVLKTNQQIFLFHLLQKHPMVPLGQQGPRGVPEGVPCVVVSGRGEGTKRALTQDKDWLVLWSLLNQFLVSSEHMTGRERVCAAACSMCPWILRQKVKISNFPTWLLNMKRQAGEIVSMPIEQSEWIMTPALTQLTCLFPANKRRLLVCDLRPLRKAESVKWQEAQPRIVDLDVQTRTRGLDLDLRIFRPSRTAFV